MAVSTQWEWGKQKKAMLQDLAKTAVSANGKAFRHLKDFTTSFIDNVVHPKTTDIPLFVLGKLVDIVADVRARRRGEEGYGLSAAEKQAQFLTRCIPLMGVEEFHYLIGELMSDKPITQIKPKVRVVS